MELTLASINTAKEGHIYLNHASSHFLQDSTCLVSTQEALTARATTAYRPPPLLFETIQHTLGSTCGITLIAKVFKVVWPKRLSHLQQVLICWLVIVPVEFCVIPGGI